MQTILGAGGAIGVELAKVLPQYTKDIRLVSRNPKKVNPTDQVMSANLLNLDDVMKAVDGSEVVYVTVGFEYSAKIWAENWPKFINNVIKACETHKAKLVFFDNIYNFLTRFCHKTVLLVVTHFYGLTYRNRALIGLQITCKQVQEGRFPRSVFTYNAYALTA